MCNFFLLLPSLGSFQHKKQCKDITKLFFSGFSALFACFTFKISLFYGFNGQYVESQIKRSETSTGRYSLETAISKIIKK